MSKVYSVTVPASLLSAIERDYSLRNVKSLALRQGLEMLLAMQGVPGLPDELKASRKVLYNVSCTSDVDSMLKAAMEKHGLNRSRTVSLALWLSYTAGISVAKRSSAHTPVGTPVPSDYLEKRKEELGLRDVLGDVDKL